MASARYRVGNHVIGARWFKEAWPQGSCSPERECFHFKAGPARTGEIPPNDGCAELGGTRGPGSTTGSGTSTSSPPSARTSTANTPRYVRTTRTVLRLWSSAASRASASLGGAAAKDPGAAGLRRGDRTPHRPGSLPTSTATGGPSRRERRDLVGEGVAPAPPSASCDN